MVYAGEHRGEHSAMPHECWVEEMNSDRHSIKVRAGEREMNDSSLSVEAKTAGGAGFVLSMHLFTTKENFIRENIVSGAHTWLTMGSWLLDMEQLLSPLSWKEAGLLLWVASLMTPPSLKAPAPQGSVSIFHTQLEA